MGKHSSQHAVMSVFWADFEVFTDKCICLFSAQSVAIWPAAGHYKSPDTTRDHLIFFFTHTHTLTSTSWANKIMQDFNAFTHTHTCTSTWCFTLKLICVHLQPRFHCNINDDTNKQLLILGLFLVKTTIHYK